MAVNSVFRLTGQIPAYIVKHMHTQQGMTRRSSKLL